MTLPELEWDEAKSAKNRLERGFGFDLAAKIFNGSTLEIDDERRNYGERRMRAIGQIEGEFFAVVYTWRGLRRRIISARIAKRRERNAYREAFPGSNYEV
jgi:uncharacterized DUF497 family protein